MGRYEWLKINGRSLKFLLSIVFMKNNAARFFFFFKKKKSFCSLFLKQKGVNNPFMHNVEK